MGALQRDAGLWSSLRQPGEAGFRPAGSVRTGQVEAAARLAAAGVGPALVPGNVIPPGLKASIARLDPPLLRPPLSAYARSEFIPLVASFVKVLRKTTTQLHHRRA